MNLALFGMLGFGGLSLVKGIWSLCGSLMVA